MFFKDKTEQRKKWTSNHSFRSNKKRPTRSLRASSWALCTFHPSSFYTLRLQRKLVNIAKTGKPTSHPHLPKYPLLFEGGKKTNKKTNHNLPISGQKHRVWGIGARETLKASGLTVTNWALYAQSPYRLSLISVLLLLGRRGGRGTILLYPLSCLFLLQLVWTNSHEGWISPRGDLCQMRAYSVQVGVFEEEEFRKHNSKGWTATCHITKYSKTFLLNLFTSQI